MNVIDTDAGIVVAGSGQLLPALRGLGLLDDKARRGLIYDASAIMPADWPQLAAELDELFRLTQQTVRAGNPVVYVVHEPSLWGHESPLRCALATAVLGGMRSAAVELTRSRISANAVALADDAEAEPAARSIAFLLDSELTGQMVTCGSAHLGRPAV